ncbi:ccaat/enhancer binding protein [Anaeramoeba flamelloides]|uniref:Ccaat/enhancer binding protein n=1 Tax=Anaeramoeba flamelloides TaxID=1746091 RepID=A0AAV7YUM8_9EUKA|nr:ccaat/enhancer binding protein [Anaeramoeba flamelloides]
MTAVPHRKRKDFFQLYQGVLQLGSSFPSTLPTSQSLPSLNNFFNQSQQPQQQQKPQQPQPQQQQLYKPDTIQKNKNENESIQTKLSKISQRPKKNKNGKKKDQLVTTDQFEEVKQVTKRKRPNPMNYRTKLKKRINELEDEIGVVGTENGDLEIRVATLKTKIQCYKEQVQYFQHFLNKSMQLCTTSLNKINLTSFDLVPKKIKALQTEITFK